jgi:hypothetical protein
LLVDLVLLVSYEIKQTCDAARHIQTVVDV